MKVPVILGPSYEVRSTLSRFLRYVSPSRSVSLICSYLYETIVTKHASVSWFIILLPSDATLLSRPPGSSLPIISYVKGRESTWNIPAGTHLAFITYNYLATKLTTGCSFKFQYMFSDFDGPWSFYLEHPH